MRYAPRRRVSARVHLEGERERQQKIGGLDARVVECFPRSLLFAYADARRILLFLSFTFPRLSSQGSRKGSLSLTWLKLKQKPMYVTQT